MPQRGHQERARSRPGFRRHGPVPSLCMAQLATACVTAVESAFVLPRGALSGSALGAWRRTILAEGSFADVCFIENTGRWAFDMEPRYTDRPSR